MGNTINIKKVFSPIFYLFFILLTFIGTLFITTTIGDAVSFIDKVFTSIDLSRLLIFLYSDKLLTPFPLVAMIVLGPILLWFASKRMYKGEKLEKPNFSDHFRQSALCYLILLSGTVHFLKEKYQGTIGDKFFYVSLPVSILAIVVNAIFLYRKYKKIARI